MSRGSSRFDPNLERSVYALGLIAATIAAETRPLLLWGSSYVREAIAAALPEARVEALSGGRFRVGSQALAKEVIDLLGGSNPAEFGWPEINAAADVWFTRGLLDATGKIRNPDSGKRLTVRFRSVSTRLAEGLLNRLGGDRSDSGLTLSGVDALDTLGTLYAGARFFRKRNRRRYLDWMASPKIAQELFLDFRLLRSEAAAPFKERISDSGYDLTLIRREKTLGNVVLYGTGISIRPPSGYYCDVVPRSSIIKRGYLLANNIGVIDRAYRGEILVPLLKVDSSAPDLELPARVVQLIPRPIRHFETRRLELLDATSRGAGGFGSSGQ